MCFFSATQCGELPIKHWVEHALTIHGDQQSQYHIEEIPNSWNPNVSFFNTVN
jgi:hypothetical protein